MLQYALNQTHFDIDIPLTMFAILELYFFQLVEPVIIGIATIQVTHGAQQPVDRSY